MADYRFIQIEQGEEEDEFETEEDEIEEDEIEIEENLIPDRNIDLNLIHESEDDDDDDSDYDDYDVEEDDDEEEILIPDIPLPVNIDHFNELLDEDDSDYDDDYDDDDDSDYDDDEEDYEDDEEPEELIRSLPERVVPSSISGDTGSVLTENVTPENPNSNDFDQRKEEVNRCEIDGLICPICFEAWTSGGQHQISCLPCGHIYGLSCIKKWLLQRRSCGKCPQCNQVCTLSDVRVLYASRLCVADEELHKRVRSLEAKCAYLEQKAAQLTHDELINQICSNPTLMERLATALADLH